jgi:nucleotide-binding universal stress UspA family protein
VNAVADRHNKGSRIVVGVDGSTSSMAALRWAARQAHLTGTSLHVVTAWDYPERPTPFSIVPDLPPTFDPLETTRNALEALLTETLGADRDIVERCSVVGGEPSSILLESARAADLLVVGNRGLSTLAGMFLGSVSRHCVSHATCPVAVIRLS